MKPTLLLAPASTPNSTASSLHNTYHTIDTLLTAHDVKIPQHQVLNLYTIVANTLTNPFIQDFQNITKNTLPGRPFPKIHIFKNATEKTVNVYLRNRSRDIALETANYDFGSKKIHRRNICRLSFDFSNGSLPTITAKKVSQLIPNAMFEPLETTQLLFNKEILVLQLLKANKVNFLFDSAMNFTGSGGVKKSVAYVESYDTSLTQLIHQKIPDEINAQSLDAAYLAIMKKTLNDLNMMHQLGLVHADPKADNILLRSKVPLPQNSHPFMDPNNFETLLIDFDQTFSTQDPEAQKQLCGTYLSMCPETFERLLSYPEFESALTNKTDMWAAGVAFYELITKTLPRWSKLIWAFGYLDATFAREKLPAGISKLKLTCDMSQRTVRNMATLKPHMDPILAGYAMLDFINEGELYNCIDGQMKRLIDLVRAIDPQSIAELFGDKEYSDGLSKSIFQVIVSLCDFIKENKNEPYMNQLKRNLLTTVIILRSEIRNLILMSWGALGSTLLPANATKMQHLVYFMMRPNPDNRPTALQALEYLSG